MAKAKIDPVSRYLAEIGSKGGKVTNKAKGFGSLTPAQRSVNAKKAAAKRWLKKRETDKK